MIVLFVFHEPKTFDIVDFTEICVRSKAHHSKAARNIVQFVISHNSFERRYAHNAEGNFIAFLKRTKNAASPSGGKTLSRH